MANQFLRIGLFACALTAAAGPGLAGGPTKADLEKALSACPPGESEGSDGLCSPTGDKRMGFDFVPQGDSGPTSGAPHADPATAHHRVVARIEKPGAVVGGFADLQITFGNASWELTDGDRDTADTLAVVMLEPDLAHKLVEISGYTSSTGTDEFNNYLSRRRADAVRAYLIAKGVPSSRLIAVGYGSSDPIEGTDPAAAENRRVVVTVLGSAKP